LDTASDTPQFVKRCTGSGQVSLEAAAWTDGNITLRIDSERFREFWCEIDINIGSLLKWYRDLRQASESGKGPEITEFKHAGALLFMEEPGSGRIAERL